MNKLFIVASLLAAFMSLVVYGQDENQARDLFQSYAATGKGQPGAKIKIELRREGEQRFVPLNTVFRAGDRVKLHFEVNFPAYVEIYNHGSSGQYQRLFPAPGTNALVKVSSNYVVPSQATEWFEFDDHPGTEQLSFIFSEAQLQPVSKPSPSTRPDSRRKSPGVTVNPESRTQQAINDLNTRALDEGRDLNRVQVKDEHYVFGSAERLHRAVGIVINLKHQ